MTPQSYHYLAIPHKVYNDVCHMASMLLDVPKTMVALLEASKKKHNCSEYPPEPMFLITHLINNFQSQSSNDILIIENVYEDERTKDICVDQIGTPPPLLL